MAESSPASTHPAMGKAPPAPDRDLRAAVTLLAEALAPDDGRTRKLHRVMTGLSDLVDADAWVWIRTRWDERPDRPPSNIDFHRGGGFDEGVLAEYAQWSLEVHGPPPENRVARALQAAGGHWTRTRGSMVADEDWHAPPVRDHTRRMGLDEFVWSMLPAVEGSTASVFSGPVLFRKLGRPAFGEAERRLVHLVVQESGVLHTGSLDPSLGTSVARLTPRQHTVLSLLLDGLEPAQIAHRLELSAHTLAEHVTAVYARFGVQSRSELLRRWSDHGTLPGRADG